MYEWNKSIRKRFFKENGGKKMNDFYKTPMGRKFFEVDFPELIKTLKRIADALEEKK